MAIFAEPEKDSDLVDENKLHEFEAFTTCANCDEILENCECEVFEPDEHDECDICDKPEDDEIHHAPDEPKYVMGE